MSEYVTSYWSRTTLTHPPHKYDGEKDTRTPHDFASNANAKHDDAGDGDDEDADDDDPDSNPRGGNKKRSDTKLKQDFGNSAKLVAGGDSGLSVDVCTKATHGSRILTYRCGR